MIFRYPHVFSPMDVLPSLGMSFVLIILLGVGVVSFKLWLNRRPIAFLSNDVTFQRLRLMTPSELAFFPALDTAAALCNSHVFVQVPLAALISVHSENKSLQTSENNRICQKRVDFVLVDKTTMGVLAVVELDDRSHLLEDRRSRDEVVDLALGKVRIPIIHWIAQARYNTGEIVERIKLTLATT